MTLGRVTYWAILTLVPATAIANIISLTLLLRDNRKGIVPFRWNRLLLLAHTGFGFTLAMLLLIVPGYIQTQLDKSRFDQHRVEEPYSLPEQWHLVMMIGFLLLIALIVAYQYIRKRNTDANNQTNSPPD